MTYINGNIDLDYSVFYDTEFDKVNELDQPGSLYEAAQYILNLKGKRIRPSLVLMSAEMFDGDLQEAIFPSLAVELFHNSTLVHDDIMDASDLRRGNPTVHKIFGLNTAINSGNILMCYAYKYLLRTKKEHFKPLVKIFNKTTIEVMEGQAMDLAFETQNVVNEDEYLKMIEFKTAVLLAASLQMGAIIGNANKEDQDNIYNFGKYLGLAFQIKDDYLDAFGNHPKVGKIIGGDILNNKKTLLYIKTLENANEQQKIVLHNLAKEKNPSVKITGMLELYRATGAQQIVLEKIKSFSQYANQYILQCQVTEEKKQALLSFAANLMHREF